MSQNCGATFLLLLSAAAFLHSPVLPTVGLSPPENGAAHEYDFVYNFTKYLHGTYRYNGFVVFSPKSLVLYRPRFLNLRSLEQALSEDFNVPVITWGLERTAKLRNNIGLNNLVFVQFSNLEDPILDVVDYTLEGLHFISILFFHYAEKNKPPTFSEIEAFFHWCWSKKMVNVALYFKLIERKYREDKSMYYEVRTQIYNYKPFPKLSVNNLTKEAENGEVRFIVDHLKNVEGYKFKTPMMPNLPYAFMLNKTRNCKTNFENCRSILAGITGRPYNEYINRLNGKVEIETVTTGDFNEDIVLAASKNIAHIGLAPISNSMSFYNASEGSYPLLQSKACIVVPMQRYIHQGHYFWCTFTLKVWFLALISFWALVLLQIGYNYVNAQVAGKISQNIVTIAIFTAFRIWLGQASFDGKIPTRRSMHHLWRLLILMMTVILANMYTASMTSMLSSFKIHKPIKTVKDFLASDLEILTCETELELYFKTKMLPTALMPRLQIVPNPYLNRHRRFLNTSYAYIFKAEHWQMGSYQQKRLKRPLFGMPSKELCTSKFYIQIPVQWDSPFLLDLNIFFMRTQENGLSLKWQELAYWDAEQMDLIDFKKPNELPWQPLTKEDFKAAPLLFIWLQLIPISVFLMELFWFNCCLKAQRQRLRKMLEIFCGKIFRKIKKNIKKAA